MFWKSDHKEDNAFLSDDSKFWYHQVLDGGVFPFCDVSLKLLNSKASTISFETSHLVINCSQLPARISCFLEAVDKTVATSDQESNLLAWKETQFCVWESNELHIWDWRQNSRYGEYVELYETFSRLVK